MPDDFYQTEGRQKEPDGSMEESDENTTLVPKSFFGGKDLEVGKKCEVEVVALYEDEVEVKYVKHKDKEEKPDEPEREDMEDPFARMGE
jgi:hypothetical protein